MKHVGFINIKQVFLRLGGSIWEFEIDTEDQYSASPVCCCCVCYPPAGGHTAVRRRLASKSSKVTTQRACRVIQSSPGPTGGIGWASIPLLGNNIWRRLGPPKFLQSDNAGYLTRPGPKGLKVPLAKRHFSPSSRLPAPSSLMTLNCCFIICVCV